MTAISSPASAAPRSTSAAATSAAAGRPSPATSRSGSTISCRWASTISCSCWACSSSRPGCTRCCGRSRPSPSRIRSRSACRRSAMSRLPAEIVEPIIAASIVFVAVENIFTRGLSPWRPAVVFLFGLLHGLGFASVLGAVRTAARCVRAGAPGVQPRGRARTAYGDRGRVPDRARGDPHRPGPGRSAPRAGAVPRSAGRADRAWPCSGTAQAPDLEVPPLVFAGPAAALCVLCWLSVTYRDQIDAYRRIVAVPVSAAIALVGAWWVLERTLL